MKDLSHILWRGWEHGPSSSNAGPPCFPDSTLLLRQGSHLLGYLWGSTGMVLCGVTLHGLYTWASMFLSHFMGIADNYQDWSLELRTTNTLTTTYLEKTKNSIFPPLKSCCLPFSSGTCLFSFPLSMNDASVHVCILQLWTLWGIMIRSHSHWHVIMPTGYIV